MTLTSCASYCPRFAGESDRRGPATAAEGSTRRAVNTCPASGTGHEARNASDGFLGALFERQRAGLVPRRSDGGRRSRREEAVCATEASIQAF